MANENGKQSTPETDAEATAKASTEKKSPFTTLGNLRHNGKGYFKGKTVLLTAKEAKPLLASKVVAPVEEKSK